MTELQKKLLEMFTWLTDYLDKNNLVYYIIAGTMLGAARHKGFIPWDDDIDIALPRPDYNRLIANFKDVKDHYKLESPFENNQDYLYGYCKFYDINTTLVERQRRGKTIKRGVFIDVFPLDGVGNTFDESIFFLKKVDKMKNFFLTQTCVLKKQRKWYKNLAIVLARCIPFINLKKYSVKIDKLASSKNYHECSYVANLHSVYREREIIQKRIFGKPTDYKFENIVVKGPELYNEYLTQIYHDWRKLPPIEKRGIQHNFVTVDLKKSYLE